MDSPVIQVSKHDQAVVLTINRPQALNALNQGVFGMLRDFFSSGYEDYLPFAGVVITGSGPKAFAAGADITEFQGMHAKEGAELPQRGKDVFFLIERFHAPVIAAVNGFALGGGCELAMACHLRIASTTARFGLPEANLGLIPGYGATQRLVQLVGKGKALELMLTGDMIDAQTAQRLGLVNDTVEAEELMDTCFKVIEKIGTKGPLAIQKVIASVNAHFNPGVDGFQEETAHFAALMETQDFIEGTMAFLEKRKAHFTRS
jgi:enoyl-CoA hydratase